MNAFCVQCGQQNIPAEEAWKRYRCPPCWQAFKAAGGILKEKEPVHTSPCGIKTGGGWIFKNYAKYCRRCGAKLLFSGKRVRYALLRGGECMMCDGCHNHLTKPEWYPDPLLQNDAR